MSIAVTVVFKPDNSAPEALIRKLGVTRYLSLVTYVEQVLKKLKELEYGSLATIIGRYYAMDRDKRWERIKLAYEGLVQGTGEVTTADNVIEVKWKDRM